MRIYSLFLIYILIASCSKTVNNNTGNHVTDSLLDVKNETIHTIDSSGLASNSVFQLASYLTPSATNVQGIINVDYDCAIIIYPTDKQINEMKIADGEDFYTVADDN